jgi:WD40 repeat protein
VLAPAENPRRRRAPSPIPPADGGLGEAPFREWLDDKWWGAWGVALDPTGALLAIGTDHGGVLLWDVRAARLRRRLATAAAVRSLAFSGDGRLLAAAESSRVRVWDVATGAKVACLQGSLSRVTSITFLAASTAARADTLSRARV